MRVLGDNGQGNLSDVREGIEWAIFHAPGDNICILHLSPAASSSASWQTDPLRIAVRRASVAGLAAANKEAYGTIGSPGIDPSVITVGAANTKATGVRRIDNLLQPDPVAPGKRIVGAEPGLERAGAGQPGPHHGRIDEPGLPAAADDAERLLDCPPAVAGTVALCCGPTPA